MPDNRLKICRPTAAHEATGWTVFLLRSALCIRVPREILLELLLGLLGIINMKICATTQMLLFSFFSSLFLAIFNEPQAALIYADHPESERHILIMRLCFYELLKLSK